VPHACFESLESRRLLAFAGTFTDTDNDVYAVELIGAGSAVATTSAGGTSGCIQNLQVTGTDTKSILRVRVTNAAGDGRIPLQVLNTTLLRQLLMPAVDLRPNGDVDVADAAKIVMGNIGDNADVRFDFDPALTGSRSTTFGTASTSIVRVLGPGSAITSKAWPTVP
jgi:hypothetical protein